MTLQALLEESRTDRENWHFTSLKKVETLTLKPVEAPPANVALPASLSRHRLVFVDGFFRADLSDLQALPDDLVAPCNAQGTCCSLTLSDQTCLAIDPVEILFVSTPQAQPSEASTTLKIALGENSRLTLIERHVVAEKGAVLRHFKTEITLGKQAKLIHGKVVSSVLEGLHVAQTSVHVAAGSFYDHFALLAGGGLTRCETTIDLLGELAETRLLALMLLRQSQHCDVTTHVRHRSPHTASRQICKSVLADKARGVFQGQIHVAPDAQKTDGYQLCRALLLSDKAEMDAKPELEIFADDVQCSHGTTIGDLDEESLFYLMSRGLDPATARALLIRAFVDDLTGQLPAGELQTLLQNEVSQWLLPY
ncbi:MAG: Fe-S cluster assembly protein SufD [Bdellovibrionales bacterium]